MKTIEEMTFNELMEHCTAQVLLGLIDSGSKGLKSCVFWAMKEAVMWREREEAKKKKKHKENDMIRNEKEIRKAAQDYIDVEVKPRDEEEKRKCVECYSVGFWLAADIKDVERDDDVKKLYLKELYEHFIFENKEQSFTSMIEWLLNQLWIRDRRDFKLDLLGKEVAEDSGTNDDE